MGEGPFSDFVSKTEWSDEAQTAGFHIQVTVELSFLPSLFNHSLLQRINVLVEILVVIFCRFQVVH